MIKQKTVSYLDRFRDDVKTSIADLEDFDKNKKLKAHFEDILIDSLDVVTCYSESDYPDVNMVNLEQLINFLIENDEKLELEILKELYWLVVSFIFEQVYKNPFDVSRKVYQNFDEDEVDGLFAKLGMTFEEFLLILSTKSLLEVGTKIPSLPNFQDFKISYQRSVPTGDFVWYRDVANGIECSNVVLEGDLVVIDGKTFDEDFFNILSKSELGLLKSKFFRVFALNFLEVRDNKFLKVAISSLINDKSLKKLFIKTMNRNLCEIASYSPEELFVACKQSRIPLYEELKSFLSANSINVSELTDDSFPLDF